MERGLLLAILSVTVGAMADASVAASDASPARLSPREAALLDRLTWGLNSATAKAIARLGPERFLDQQLHPSSSPDLPAQAQSEIDSMTLSRDTVQNLAIASAAQGKGANAIADPVQRQAAKRAQQERMNLLAREAATRSLLRDLYSPDQLQEQMTWFWLNHFNVFAPKADIRVLIGDYEDRTIRPHALGRFRDLLGATARSPAMLRYLDNDKNAAGRINENYAREIMELHTLGVNGGYTQKDVEELARIFTGVGVNMTDERPNVRPTLRSQYVRDGLFEFNPNRHDYGDKIFLGHRIRGRGLAEVDEALDILARSPQTALFVSRKLAVYFVADDPPPGLVERMAARFTRTHGDIAAVLKTMFVAPEFTASLGGKFKDPMHWAISSLRLAYDDSVILNAAPLLGWLGRMSEPPYGHETPDGYSLTEASWRGPGEMSTRFAIARIIGSGSAGLFHSPGPPPVDEPAFPRLENALYFAGEDATLAAATKQSLSQALSQQEWNTLFLASPEFMHR